MMHPVQIVLPLQLYVQSETTHLCMDDVWSKAIVKYIDTVCVQVSVSLPLQTLSALVVCAYSSSFLGISWQTSTWKASHSKFY